MKRKTTVILAACIIASSLLAGAASKLQAEDVFVTIGGGDFTGVYFPTGLAIAKLITANRPEYGIRATVEATPGSIFNLNAILAGYLDFGLAQANHQHRAYHGLLELERWGPKNELRSVFSIHHESLTLVAAVDADIETIADLKGKRVSFGIPGSGQHRIVKETLVAVGIDPDKDIAATEVAASEAPVLLQDDRIDAYFFVVGHPSESIRMALSSERKTRIIPISGPAVDEMVSVNSFYLKKKIDMKRFYPGLGEETGDIDTFGVMATLCTSSRVPEEVVYVLTKEVFENFDSFRRQHPALVEISKEGMLEGLSAPLHPGALRYFKEAGLIK